MRSCVKWLEPALVLAQILVRDAKLPIYMYAGNISQIELVTSIQEGMKEAGWVLPKKEKK